MLRLLAVITAAAARPEDATEYFDAASSLLITHLEKFFLLDKRRNKLFFKSEKKSLSYSSTPAMSYWRSAVSGEGGHVAKVHVLAAVVGVQILAGELAYFRFVPFQFWHRFAIGCED